MEFFAHSKNAAGEFHLLADHLKQVANQAKDFADKFDAGELAYLAGLLHDIGKYSCKFQQRIRGDAVRVDHSTAGAKEAYARYKLAGQLLAYAITGHHGGIPDAGNGADPASLYYRLHHKLVEAYGHFAREVALPETVRLPNFKNTKEPAFSAAFLIRMIFSCLVDADFLDTEHHMDNKRSTDRSIYPSLSYLNDRLEQFLQESFKDANETLVNMRRRAVQEACVTKATRPSGLYTLAVPTGGGKTLSSLSFALKHAVHHNKDRVIYVIPYNNIIEQNAAVFRNALGDDSVLEHHSSFIYPEEHADEWSPELKRHSLAAENWDMPLVVTTSVQFYESLYSNKVAKCRKLHNIANSVIILDEFQILPTEVLKPCLAAICELVSNYNCTVVLCTATQPAVRQLLTHGLTPEEITPDAQGLSKALRRVAIRFVGKMVDEALASELAACSQVLCIVNTTRHARELFNRVSSREGTYHLSSRMCPVHRREILDKIRKALVDGQPCCVVATQLVEAGVDLDFPVVYRSIAGLDSIMQAAGRCNREGRKSTAHTYVFEPEKHGLPKGWFSRIAEISKMVNEQYEDVQSLDAIKHYFDTLYHVQGHRLDENGILSLIQEDAKRLLFPMEKIGTLVRLIKDNQQAIIIPYDDNVRETIKRLPYVIATRSIARKLQPYTVQIYPDLFNHLQQCGMISQPAPGYWVLTDESQYDRKGGLITQVNHLTHQEFLNV